MEWLDVKPGKRVAVPNLETSNLHVLAQHRLRDGRQKMVIWFYDNAEKSAGGIGIDLTLNFTTDALVARFLFMNCKKDYGLPVAVGILTNNEYNRTEWLIKKVGVQVRLFTVTLSL